jgi:hypothetical protein
MINSQNCALPYTEHLAESHHREKPCDATDGFFHRAVRSPSPRGSRTVLNIRLIESVRRGTQTASDLDAASGLLDLAQDELEAFGTSGGEHS